MRGSIADQLKDYQVDFVQKAQQLDETAETSHNPEYQHEMADTLRTLSHTDAQTVEELDNNDEQPELERPSNNFMIGTRFSDMEEEPPDPIWPGWFYRGKITGIIGEEGTGKSTLMTALAAIFSTGRPAPDGSRVQKGNVLYIGPEEDDEGTVLSRLKTEDADLFNVVSVRRIFGKGFKLPTHQDMLESAILHYKACLVVVDPITACVAKGSTLNTLQGCYDILDPLQNMLHEARCSLVFINHFTKSKAAKTSDRGALSKGLYNFLRVYCTLYIDPLTGKVILHEDKNNLIVDGSNKPNDVYIERLENGKLFFAGAGATADFRHATDQQRLSMNQQAVMAVLDSDPMRDFESGEIHQCIRLAYSDMPYSTTRSSLRKLSNPEPRTNTIRIGKSAWGCYFSLKRLEILAAEQATSKEEETQPDTTTEGLPVKPSTIATIATTTQDVAQQATMVLDEGVKA